LGHEVTIVGGDDEAYPRMLDVPTMEQYDVVYTDYVGADKMRSAGVLVQAIKDRLRILDMFGTDAEFNGYSRDDPHEARVQFCCLQLPSARQYYTFYPLPDNSFLGFAILLPQQRHAAPVERGNQAVIWGKDRAYWNEQLAGKKEWYSGLQAYLRFLSTKVELHATIAQRTMFTEDTSSWNYVPSFIHNHGYLNSSSALAELLLRSRMFVGLGFPFDGPAPFEALASGCVFLNRKFSTPQGPKNNPFLSGRPFRQHLYQSQHRYLGRFGPPSVYNVDVRNLTAVREVVDQILLRPDHEFRPVLPYEMGVKGFIERVDFLIHNR